MMMDEPVVIRKAELKDLERIADFNIKMARETEGKELDKNTVMKGVGAVINDPNRGFYLIAEKDDLKKRLAGQLMITFEWSDWRNKFFWWIQGVYVDKTYRNKKIFSRLFSRIVEVAKQRKNVFGFRLYVEKHNESAKRVYEALGLTRTSYEVYETEF
jgi:ribosomal protein S18 acetylase RimI-like enzyme